MPRKHHLERAGLCRGQQRRQSSPGLGGAIAGDRFIGEPLDDGESFAGGKLGRFRALFGGRLVLRPAGHTDIGRRGNEGGLLHRWELRKRRWAVPLVFQQRELPRKPCSPSTRIAACECGQVERPRACCSGIISESRVRGGKPLVVPMQSTTTGYYRSFRRPGQGEGPLPGKPLRIRLPVATSPLRWMVDTFSRLGLQIASYAFGHAAPLTRCIPILAAPGRPRGRARGADRRRSRDADEKRFHDSPFKLRSYCLRPARRPESCRYEP